MDARRCVSPCRGGAQYVGPLARGSPQGSGTIAWGSRLSLQPSPALPIAAVVSSAASPATTPPPSQRNSNASPPPDPSRASPTKGTRSPTSVRKEATATPQRFYTGSFSRGLKHGTGCSTLRSGTSYSGSFDRDLRHGQGTQIYSGGARFEGEFRENRPEGPGRARFSSGGACEGTFVEGSMHGQGTLTLPDGSTFTGSFVRGRRHGQGTTVWPDGDSYTGEYVHDVRAGRGEYAWKDGRAYAGEFANGMRHGHGILSFPSGDKFEGEYAEDLRMGPGVYCYHDGRIDRGLWRDAKLVALDPESSECRGPLTELSLQLLATAVSGDAEQALALLATGSLCVDVCDSNGRNALFLACLRSHTALVNILLDNGANINQVTPRGTSALVATYRLSRGLASETVAAATTADVDAAGGREALLGTVYLLLRRGADPNGSVFPDSILSTAVTQHCLDMVDLLLARGADPSLRRPETGGTILHEVVSDCVKSRLDASSRGSVKSQSPLLLLAKLLKHGGDPNIADPTGCLPLHRACAAATPEAAKAAAMLLQHHAHPDRRWKGLTPLFLAVSCGAAATVDTLLAHHADPNEGAENRTLLQVAVMLMEPQSDSRNTDTAHKFAENRLRIIERLLEAGADPTTVTSLLVPPGVEVPVDTRGTALDQGYYSYVLSCDIHTRNPSMLSALDRVQLNAEQAVLRLLANSMRGGRRPTSGVSRWCEECGRSVGVVLVACARCQRVFFCSQQCKMRGYAYHRRMCTAGESSISLLSTPKGSGDSQTSLVPTLKWLPQGHPDRPPSGLRPGTTATQPGLTLGIHPAPSRLSLFPSRLLDTSGVSPTPLSKQPSAPSQRRSRTLVAPSSS